MPAGDAELWNRYFGGIAAGFINRWILLRYDYRHYPTYPHGHVTHLALGFIAASLGAVAIPAIAEPDYVSRSLF